MTPSSQKAVQDAGLAARVSQGACHTPRWALHLLPCECTCTHTTPTSAVQLLASHLSWPSVLDARQTCRHWAAALDPLITHLRVPLTAPDGEQLVALLPAALDKFTGVTSVTLLLTYSTTAQSLQEALHTVGSKVRGQLTAPQISWATHRCGYSCSCPQLQPRCQHTLPGDVSALLHAQHAPASHTSSLVLAATAAGQHHHCCSV